MINNLITWLTTSANWSTEDGIPNRLQEHLQYSLGALAIAMLIALPLGLYVGHTGRGALGIAGVANALRALPTFGLLIFVVSTLSGYLSGDFSYLGPSLLVLIILGVLGLAGWRWARPRARRPAPSQFQA